MEDSQNAPTSINFSLHAQGDPMDGQGLFNEDSIKHFDDTIPREWWQDGTRCIVLGAQSLTKGCVHLSHLGDTQLFPETRFAVSFLH